MNPRSLPNQPGSMCIWGGGASALGHSLNAEHCYWPDPCLCPVPWCTSREDRDLDVSKSARDHVLGLDHGPAFQCLSYFVSGSTLALYMLPLIKSSPQFHELSTIIIPILLTRKLRPIEVTGLAQGHTASKWQS